MKARPWQFVATFAAGAAIGVVVGLSLDATSMFEPILGAIVTMAATFIGAWYAFHLAQRSEAEKEEAAIAEAGNHVIFKLGRVRNNFSTLRRQLIEPYQNHPFRAFYILPTSSLGSYEVSALSDLAGFFDSSDPLLVNELMNLEMEIVTTLEWIDRRSDVHTEAQHRLDSRSVPETSFMQLEQLQQFIGFRLAQQLQSLTDDMITGVDAIVAGCERLIPRLNARLRAKYPKQTALRMEFPAQQVVPADRSASASLRQSGG